MSRHTFDPQIASEVGINAAVIYQNIVWWCEKNAANGRNIHDGQAWTYNSMRAFSALFPYLTERQIRTALQKLEDTKYLLVGCYNKDARDRTKWYAVEDKSVTLHLTSKSDGPDLDVAPLPVSKPVINKPPSPQGGDDLFPDLGEQTPPDRTNDLIGEGFKEFWETIWPKHNRKTQKSDCCKVYFKACKGEHKKADAISPAALNNAARRYIASVTDLQFLKGPLPWLNAPGWEAFMDAGDAGGALDWSTLTDSARRMLQRGQCPPSMLVDGQPNATAKAFLAQVAKK